VSRLRPAAVACAVALALAGCAGTYGDESPAAPIIDGGDPAVGVVANTLGYGAAVGRAQDTVRRAGVRLLREELSWSIVEPRRGVRHWAKTDRLMVAAAHRDMEMLVLLNGVPNWAARPDGGLPTRAAAYGAYVRDVVARYGPGGTFWRAHPTLPRASAPRWFELWNEPWFGQPVRSTLDARRYAALADAGLRAGRAADPDARFLLAADTSFVGDEQVSEAWLDRLQRAAPGLLAAADGITAHPYSTSASVSLDELDHVRAALTRRGLNLPIWVTEVGWSTCRLRSDQCVTEAQQASRLDHFLRGVARRSRSDVAKVFVYHMRDLGRLPSAREEHFGLVRLNGSRKPAWQVVRAFAAR
jgi:polysaccharide biosynthesis protein PslG